MKATMQLRRVCDIINLLKCTHLSAAICNFTSDTVKFEKIIGDSMGINKE